MNRTIRTNDPWQLVHSPFLTLAAKEKLLIEWIQDERALLSAEDDGMPGGHDSQLEDVARALLSMRHRAA
jgi:hypothetical protein